MEPLKFLICLGLILSVSARPQDSIFDEEAMCGYNKCQASVPGKLNVHIVPHTHDDVGWLKTVDQYFYGHRNNIQKAGVQYIIDSVIQELLRDPERRFVYVESAFFSKWWNLQNAKLKDEVRQLVSEGRLEFIGGAWSMNDEAAVHYNSVIDHFAWGLKFLHDNFGKCGRPKIGWQIDPFGHSREQASIFAQMGYDGLFFARLDWNDKTRRMQTQTPEMIWHGSANLAPSHSDLFTSVLFNHYSPPPGFCFDVLCNDDPVIDDLDSEDYNVQKRVNDFMNFLDRMSASYRSENLLITMGDDFHYMDANMWFSNIGKLIKYTNELHGNRVNVFYSTPSCYVKAVHQSNLTWPEKTDDFFPYANDPYTYWTGYYTSRPTQKAYERLGNRFLQVCKQLTALAPVQHNFFQTNLDRLREMMGIWQHHDAITGTEKQHVADDYALMMDKALKGCEENVKSVIQDTYAQDLKLSSCWFMNISQCEITEIDSPVHVVTLYNPLAHPARPHLRIPLTHDQYTLSDESQTAIPFQIVPIPDSVTRVQGRSSSARFELVFRSPEIQPLGFRSFTLEVKPRIDAPIVSQWTRATGDFEIENEFLKLSFRDGMINRVFSDNFSESIQQKFAWYEGANGNNAEFFNRSSGAYIFRPNNTERILVPVRVDVLFGDIVSEVHQVYNEWISQIIRLYKGDLHVELEWLVGEIPVDDGLGKEVVSRFTTNIKSNQVFYTDSNGREMLKRVRNYRETWNATILEPQAGNYYPITARIAIEDDHSRLAVLNDRAQGGSSLQDGIIELMVHRRLLRDDAFGVAEALNETVTARGTHYLLFGPQKLTHPTQKARERIWQNEILTMPWPMLSSFEQAPNLSRVKPLLSVSLPLNVRLLTLEPWGTSTDPALLVRLEHIFELDEDPEYSKAVTINLQDIFPRPIEFRETTLDGNQWIDEAVRFKFTSDGQQYSGDYYQMENEDEDDNIKLEPMQIRTFIVKFV